MASCPICGGKIEDTYCVYRRKQDSEGSPSCFFARYFSLQTKMSTSVSLNTLLIWAETSYQSSRSSPAPIMGMARCRIPASSQIARIRSKAARMVSMVGL